VGTALSGAKIRLRKFIALIVVSRNPRRLSPAMGDAPAGDLDQTHPYQRDWRSAY